MKLEKNRPWIIEIISMNDVTCPDLEYNFMGCLIYFRNLMNN